ncbi:glycosyltransferase family 2 protein, partial [Vibrio anguillarum]|nr:glycosyltransferase family 2 protein [Vibrio anguillarum]
MTNNKKKVTIGICTYRRPEQLKELLVSIFEANDTSEFILTIAIVDNDENRSANEVASLFYNENINVIYHCEFSRNISDVRNK